MENYNQAVWPGQIFGWLLAFLSPFLIGGNKRRNAVIVPVVFAALWAMIGYKFHLGHFANVQLAAPYFAGLFFVQAALFLLCALTCRPLELQSRRSLAFWSAAAVYIFCLIGYLPVALLAGRSVTELGLMGWGPDTTVLGTTALLMMTKRSWAHALLTPLALLWGAISALMAYGLESWDFYWLFPATIVLLLAGMAKLTQSG